MILVPCSISAFSLFDTIIRQSSFTRDTIAEFVNCVALFEVLLIDCKITESICKKSKSLISSIIRLSEKFNLISNNYKDYLTNSHMRHLRHDTSSFFVYIMELILLIMWVYFYHLIHSNCNGSRNHNCLVRKHRCI